MTDLGTALATALTGATGDVIGLLTDNVAVLLAVPVVFVGWRYVKRLVKGL